MPVSKLFIGIVAFSKEPELPEDKSDDAATEKLLQLTRKYPFYDVTILQEMLQNVNYDVNQVFQMLSS